MASRPNEFEQQLEQVRAMAAGAKEGVFGPESMIWRVDRESLLFLGAGRALLLQLAHPWVAAAVSDHSRAFSDPLGRFHRTFEVVFTLAFGTLDQALAAATRLHRRHAAITGRMPGTAGPFPAGSHYSATDKSALQWVHATLVDSAALAHDLVLPPLNHDERERYYRETRLLGMLFGIPVDLQPQDWSSFQAYCQAMQQSETLTATGPARDLAAQALSGAGMPIKAPSWYRSLTAAMLPDRLRSEFGLSCNADERRACERALRWIRRVYPVLPARLRYVGPYQEALERMSGATRPGPLTRGLNRLWIGRPWMDG